MIFNSMILFLYSLKLRVSFSTPFCFQDPFSTLSSFRLNHGTFRSITLTSQDYPYTIELTTPGDLIRVLDGKDNSILAELNAAAVTVQIEDPLGKSLRVGGIMGDKKVDAEVALVREGEVVVFGKVSVWILFVIVWFVSYGTLSI